jgi:hypothetical protein
LDQDLKNNDIEKPYMIGTITNNLIKYDEKRYVGHMFAFWYKKGDPVILIGPHCKLIFFI